MNLNTRRTDNAAGIQRSNKRFLARDSHLRVGVKPALGSHLVTARTLYSHHGIYVGNDHVIHYAGTCHGLRRGPVEEVSLEHFAHGRGIRVRHDRPRFDPREAVARARSRLGECSYRILTNNCEHFCEWCLNGASRSSQVERWLSGARRFTCALLGTLGLAAGTPSFADSASEHAAAVEARTLAAVPAVQFAQIDQAGVRPQLMFERTIAGRVEPPHASPDALVRGYGEALTEILSQLIPDLAAVIPRDHRATSVRSQPRRSSNSGENREQDSPD